MADFVITTDLEQIQQTKIVANFEEAVAAVREIARPYQGLIVTADTMKGAAVDRARLRKLRDRLDEQRKAVKAACMAPADAFAAALAPALQEIDAAVENIDRQIKEMEEASRADKMKELEEFFLSVLPPEIADYVTFDRIAAMHPKWKNKGCSMTEAKNDIQLDLANIKRGVSALRGYPEQYKAALLDAFSVRFDLGDVVAKYARLQEVEAQEAARASKEARKAPGMKEPIRDTENPAQADETREEPVTDEAKCYDFRVWATREQIAALREFLINNRIRYGKVPKE